ncbi:polysaccharide deacetylase family protein [Leucobacter sp. VD1]|uniref:polysaccharide deacetylase family protein n=1 Tax=Leucobacter sp. VD1 TaxID=3080381 RepID=UPI003015D7CD
MQRQQRDRRNARSVRAMRLVCGTVAVALLAGCAQIAPVAGWKPPEWPSAAGVSLVLADEATGGSAGSVVADGTAAIGGQDLGFIERRLRNDRARLQARYVEIPGWHRFNARMIELLHGAIAATGTAIAPEVFPVAAGLSHGGCVPGAASRPAAQLLADPLTGPLDGTGAGTSFVCEITTAFGSIVGVTARTVVGGPEGVTSDSVDTLYADVATGEVHESGDLWSAEAPGQMWTSTVELLRRQAGGLSAAPVAAPDDAQLQLARRALASARFTESGASVVLPAGISAPELAGLGLKATDAVTTVDISGEQLAAWLSPFGVAMQAGRGAPFAGMPTWRADQPVDCSLLACVAVTYDDGPSEHTARLLDTLRAEQSAATFFMIGSAVRAQPELAQRVATEGHGIGSHTMTHPDLTTVSPDKARTEVLDAGAMLTRVTGRTITTYRPPYGAVNERVLAAVGQPAILWSIDTLDWKKPGREELVQRSVGVAAPGDIILFHDSHAETVDSAEVVLRGLRDRGFTLVTVDQLFGGQVPGGRVTRR